MIIIQGYSREGYFSIFFAATNNTNGTINQSILDRFVRNVRLTDNLYLIKIQQIN
jgi:hypothetical protein